MAYWMYLMLVPALLFLLTVLAKWREHHQWYLSDRDMAEAMASGWVAKDELFDAFGTHSARCEATIARWRKKRWLDTHPHNPTFDFEIVAYVLTERGKHKAERINRRGMRLVSQPH